MNLEDAAPATSGRAAVYFFVLCTHNHEALTAEMVSQINKLTLEHVDKKRVTIPSDNCFFRWSFLYEFKHTEILYSFFAYQKNIFFIFLLDSISIREIYVNFLSIHIFD